MHHMVVQRNGSPDRMSQIYSALESVESANYGNFRLGFDEVGEFAPDCGRSGFHAVNNESAFELAPAPYITSKYDSDQICGS